MKNLPEKDVIIFDGYCNFCSRTVDVVIRADKNDNFLFIASQSSSGVKLLQQFGISKVESICLIQNGKFFSKSDAALMIVKKLSAPWRWLTVFNIFPRSFRNEIYMFISNRRYKWFGKRASCKVPNEKYRSKFIA